MADEATFEMTAAHLTRTIARAAARERKRAARLLDDKSDELLGMGDLAGAKLAQEMAEAIRSNDAPPAEAPVDPAALGDGDRDYHRVGEGVLELPPVQHLDDFAEGQALVRSGADRRSVVGYNGATGHLRD